MGHSQPLSVMVCGRLLFLPRKKWKKIELIFGVRNSYWIINLNLIKSYWKILAGNLISLILSTRTDNQKNSA